MNGACKKEWSFERCAPLRKTDAARSAAFMSSSSAPRDRFATFDFLVRKSTPLKPARSLAPPAMSCALSVSPLTVWSAPIAASKLYARSNWSMPVSRSSLVCSNSAFSLSRRAVASSRAALLAARSLSSWATSWESFVFWARRSYS